MLEITCSSIVSASPRNERFFSIRLGDHPKAAIEYHFKTGHREAA
jgi:hypothetical protein